MTESFCGYPGDRDEALIAFLYDDGGDVHERTLFEAHLMTCLGCRDELDALRGVRAQLGKWAPPEPSFALISHQSSVISPGHQSQWRQIPAWAQVAAALLVLGVSAGIANLDVRYDANGLSVRTGWMTPRSGDARVSPVQSGPTSSPSRQDLAAIESRLTSELQAVKASMAAMQPVQATRAVDPDVLRRVRALLDESEKRQQRELALRVAEVMRDVTAQRRADLVNIDRTLGQVEKGLGVEVMRDRQRLNLLYRASQRQ
jgi:hypothetical protein